MSRGRERSDPYRHANRLGAFLLTDPADDHDLELAHSRPTLPFLNQVISYTGLTWERAALSDKLRAMGVKYIHMDLTLDCTALISRGHESVKYEVSCGGLRYLVLLLLSAC